MQSAHRNRCTAYTNPLPAFRMLARLHTSSYTSRPLPANTIMAATFVQKTTGASQLATKSTRAFTRRAPVVVRAQKTNGSAEEMGRRAVLTAMGGAATLLAAAPAFAAYGDSANVFGKVTNRSGFVPFVGEGWTVLIPSKWNPSREVEYNSQVFRYEDNFDAVNNAVVLVEKTDKKSIEEFGDAEKYLNNITYLLGEQSYFGDSQSEGGFAKGKVAAASLLNVAEAADQKGKKYYQYEFLVRSADGDEGGRHLLIKTGISNGLLYTLKVQVGDKRWFKGVKNAALGMQDSFTVA